MKDLDKVPFDPETGKFYKHLLEYASDIYLGPKKQEIEMKHITSFESFVGEGAFHAALADARKQGGLDESTLNEAVDQYYTVDWNRTNEKNIFDYKNKMMDLAEKALAALPAILEETNPGLFDVENLGFAFKGNAAFVFANAKGKKERFALDYGKIEDNKEFGKYFDLASANLDSYSAKNFSSYFRLDDRKR